MKWHIKLEALQPISIATKRSAESQWDSVSYIAGSTWRGALAEHWKYTVGFNHPSTEKFIKDSIFHDAYVDETNFTPIFFKVGKKTGQKINVLQPYIQTGYFTVKNDEEVLLGSDPYETQVLQNSSMGIEMSRTRESTASGKLYTMSSIAEGAIFETTAVIDEEVVNLLAPTGEVEVFIGKKRFSGYGKTKVTFTKHQEVASSTKQRLAHQQIGGNELVLVLTAKSETIVYDPFLRPATTIHWQQHMTPLLTDSLKELQPLSEETWGFGAIRNGWNQRWNLPKPVEHVLRPGTTYIAKFEKEQEPQLLEAIDFILARGIGEKVTEGFGQFELAQFDLQQQELDFSVNYSEKDEQFTPEEEATILAYATKFVATVKNTITISQWQALLDLENPIDDIMSTAPEAYIERRLKTDLRNKWKTYVGSKRVGDLLREDVNLIKIDFKGKGKLAVRLYLSFIARNVRMIEKEGKKYGK